MNEKLPPDFTPPYSVNSWEGKNNKVTVEIYNDNYVIAKIELGTAKERLALARFIADACNARSAIEDSGK